MPSNRLLAATALALLASAQVARAEAVVTPKHLLILRPGLESVVGSYVFAVQNADEQPAHLKTKVMLPKETVDFGPQEGAEPSELTLAPEGGVYVEKDFPKGVTIVSIGFKANAAYGKTGLTFTPTAEIPSLTVLVPRTGGLSVSSSLLAPAAGNAPDPQYEALHNVETIKAEAPFVLDVSGLPEGRTRIWIVGGIVGGMLVLLAGAMALRTRPKITGDAGSAVLTG